MLGTAHLSAIAVTAALLVAPTPASSQQSAEQRGEALVTRHCAMCHGIGRSTTSPNPSAPSFRTLSATYDLATLEEQLGKGALFGHPMMPNFALTPGEARAVVRYLQSVRDR